MPLLGRAAVAMWWDMAPAQRAEFEHWHTHEHFPERLGIPGFLRASRWQAADGGEGFFVMYELQDHATLSSPAYLARLNQPTPWSVKMMPHHRHMVRSQCQVLESFGGGSSRWLWTLRLSPAASAAGRLQAALRELLQAAAGQPGVSAAHLLHTQAPAIAATIEQKIRGGADAEADWIVLLGGYEAETLAELAAGAFSAGALESLGAARGAQGGLYGLSLSMVAADLPPPGRSLS